MNNNTFLVVDLEATCWEDRRNAADMEIIEIGAVKVSARTLQIDKGPELLVKPRYSEVSDFCTKLTSITPQMLEDKGTTLKEAVDDLRSFCDPANRVWVSWGLWDRLMFEKQCGKPEWGYTPYPFSQEHVNLRMVFTQALGLSSRPSMPDAMTLCGLDLDGTHHRGNDDAYNTARIWVQLMRHGRTMLQWHISKEQRELVRQYTL